MSLGARKSANIVGSVIKFGGAARSADSIDEISVSNADTLPIARNLVGPTIYDNWCGCWRRDANEAAVSIIIQDVSSYANAT